MDNYQLANNGPIDTIAESWFTQTSKFGWSVEGIFPLGSDVTSINCVFFNREEELIATGDQNGIINLFRNPARIGHRPISLRGHGD
jgi:hypothetical protein